MSAQEEHEDCLTALSSYLTILRPELRSSIVGFCVDGRQRVMLHVWSEGARNGAALDGAPLFRVVAAADSSKACYARLVTPHGKTVYSQKVDCSHMQSETSSNLSLPFWLTELSSLSLCEGAFPLDALAYPLQPSQHLIEHLGDDIVVRSRDCQYVLKDFGLESDQDLAKKENISQESNKCGPCRYLAKKFYENVQEKLYGGDVDGGEVIAIGQDDEHKEERPVVVGKTTVAPSPNAACDGGVPSLIYLPPSIQLSRTDLSSSCTFPSKKSQDPKNRAPRLEVDALRVDRTAVKQIQILRKEERVIKAADEVLPKRKVPSVPLTEEREPPTKGANFQTHSETEHLSALKLSKKVTGVALREFFQLPPSIRIRRSGANRRQDSPVQTSTNPLRETERAKNRNDLKISRLSTESTQSAQLSATTTETTTETTNTVQVLSPPRKEVQETLNNKGSKDANVRLKRSKRKSIPSKWLRDQYICPDDVMKADSTSIHIDGRDEQDDRKDNNCNNNDIDYLPNNESPQDTNKASEDPLVQKTDVKDYTKVVVLKNDTSLSNVEPTALSTELDSSKAVIASDENSNGNKRRRLECSKCSRVYTKPFFLKKHQETCPGVQRSNNQPDKCLLCMTEYKIHAQFVLHMEGHKNKLNLEEPVECPECKILLSNRMEINTHYARVHNPTMGVCAQCFEVMPVQDLHGHLRKHNYDDRKHLCTVCGASFAFPGQLSVHMSRHDSSKTSVVCHLCGKVLPHQQKLAQHMSLVHNSDGRTYPCSQCHKVFATAQRRNRHEILHFGEKPFRCPLCPYRGARKDTVQSHAKKAHQRWLRPEEVKGGVYTGDRRFKKYKRMAKQEQLAALKIEKAISRDEYDSDDSGEEEEEIQEEVVQEDHILQ